MPRADLTLPSSPSPASVTPKCKGKAMFSSAMRATSKRYACTITWGLEDFIDTTTLW